MRAGSRTLGRASTLNYRNNELLVTMNSVSDELVTSRVSRGYRISLLLTEPGATKLFPCH